MVTNRRGRPGETRFARGAARAFVRASRAKRAKRAKKGIRFEFEILNFR